MSVWWMRVVGLLYVLMFVMAAIVKAPVRAEGPPGVLDLASAGNPVARFVVDTWVTLGLELGAVGVALLVASRVPDQARALVWTVCGMELAAMIADVYKIARGYEASVPVTWMIIHTAIIATGLRAMKDAPPALGETSAERPPAPF